jgi:hypothetical protein
MTFSAPVLQLRSEEDEMTNTRTVYNSQRSRDISATHFRLNSRIRFGLLAFLWFHDSGGLEQYIEMYRRPTS